MRNEREVQKNHTLVLTYKNIVYILLISTRNLYIVRGEDMKKNQSLIKARKEKALTQSQLAILMNCQKTTISNWENGYAKPKLIDAFRLAKILGKSVDSIFFEDKVQDSHTSIESL